MDQEEITMLCKIYITNISADEGGLAPSSKKF
jgi:hypothetical protein